MQLALTQRLRRWAARPRVLSCVLAFAVMATTLYLPMRELAGALPLGGESEPGERGAPTEQEERDGTDELRAGGVVVAPLPAPSRRRVAGHGDRNQRGLSCCHLSVSVRAERGRTARPSHLRLRI